MVNKYTLCLSLFLVLTACTKEKPLEVPEQKKEDPKPDTKPDPEPQKEEYHYVTKTLNPERTQHYVASDVSDKLFTGSVWHLKDTSDNVYLEPLSYTYEPFEITLISNLEFEDGMATHAFMANYVKKHGTNNISGFNYAETEFSDYAEIQRWLPKNVDVDKVLNITRQQDSTIIRKPHSLILHSENILFEVMVDQTIFFENFTQKHLTKIKASGQSPYSIDMAVYGKHLILMAESDSTTAQLKVATKKLLEKQELSNLDENVIAASKVLIYYRGGGKDSFIEQKSGKEGIQSLVNSFFQEWERKGNLYDYPLYYIASNIEDNSTLRYNSSFSYLVKEKIDNKKD